MGLELRRGDALARGDARLTPDTCALLSAEAAVGAVYRGVAQSAVRVAIAVGSSGTVELPPKMREKSPLPACGEASARRGDAPAKASA